MSSPGNLFCGTDSGARLSGVTAPYLRGNMGLDSALMEKFALVYEQASVQPRYQHQDSKALV